MAGATEARGGRLAAWQAEYLRSLKAVEVEEFLDLVLYRPVAFLLTKVLQHTRVTPNQVSVASLVCGVVAGGFFWTGHAHAWSLAALAYFACNTLDCADGQLARLRGGGTPLGYMVDGVIDYAASVAIFVGMAHGLGVARPGESSWWWLAGAAGACYAWQCAILDHKRTAWLYWVHGRAHDTEAEIRMFRQHLDDYRREGGRPVERFLIMVYLAYHAMWRRLTPRREAPERTPERVAAWAPAHRPVLRMATWMGPTTQMTLIMISGLARRPDLFLWGTLTLGNAYALGVLLAERRASARYQRAMARIGGAADPASVSGADRALDPVRAPGASGAP